MEKSMEQEKAAQQVTRKKGGLITMPFIIANETFEKAASVGLHVNLTLYLYKDYHFAPATSATILFLWNALSSFLTIFGAFLSDSYMGRFRVIGWATVIELLGLIVLWLTALLSKARPLHCFLNGGSGPCDGPTLGQILFLFSSLALMAIGAGGIRPCSLAFAADQIKNPANPQNERILKSFFNWYYVSVGVSIGISVTFIVYVQVKAGWPVGFGIAVGLMLFSTVMYFLGSPLYVKAEPNKSLLAGLAQATVAAWKNRHVSLPPKKSVCWYYRDGSPLVEPTDKLRFLNKACIIKNREKDLDSDGMPIEPWSLCTVRQVEELKALIKVLPIWSTGIMLAASISQHTFPVIQAGTMDRHLSKNFELPETNYGVFAILTLTLWVAFYDRILVPLLSRHTKKRKGLSFKQRMGIGLALSCLAMAVAAMVERKRRNLAIRAGFENNPRGVVSMNAVWLACQFSLIGLAEGFNAIGQIEFYYSQFPKSMSSIAVAFFSLGFGVGNMVAGLIVTIVKNVTQRGGRDSWLSSNINRGHYDYYYWLLCFLGLINLAYFIICSWAYGSTEDIKAWDEEDDIKLETRKEIEII